MKTIYRITAIFLDIIHIPIVFIIFFGWVLNGFWSYVYLAILIITLLCWQILGYCPVTKWEFDIRRKYMNIPSYHYEYLHYWGYKFLNISINPKKVQFYGSLFIIVSIIIWFIK